MVDFNTVYKERGEHFIHDLLTLWERSSCTKHNPTITLEDRWNYFIRATDHAATMAA